jgi:hypothetical protein
MVRQNAGSIWWSEPIHDTIVGKWRQRERREEGESRRKRERDSNQDQDLHQRQDKAPKGVLSETYFLKLGLTSYSFHHFPVVYSVMNPWVRSESS